MDVIASGGSFRDVVGADGNISARLTPSELDRCFDLEHALAHAAAIVERAATS